MLCIKKYRDFAGGVGHGFERVAGLEGVVSSTIISEMVEIIWNFCDVLTHPFRYNVWTTFQLVLIIFAKSYYQNKEKKRNN